MDKTPGGHMARLAAMKLAAFPFSLVSQLRHYSVRWAMPWLPRSLTWPPRVSNMTLTLVTRLGSSCCSTKPGRWSPPARLLHPRQLCSNPNTARTGTVYTMQVRADHSARCRCPCQHMHYILCTSLAAAQWTIRGPVAPGPYLCP